MSLTHRIFEWLSLAVILFSVVVFPIELEWQEQLGELPPFFWYAELFITVYFTVEYFIRWWLARSWRYPLRPLAIVDLLALLPFYLTMVADLRAIRLVRLLRLARLLKLYRYTTALESIRNAFERVRYEFGVVGFALFTLSWICAILIYEFEHPAQPEVIAHFTDAAWYVIVTITTVGYGDKVPITPAGRVTAAILMLGGLGLFGTFVSLIGSAFVEELRLRKLRHRPHVSLPLFTLPGTEVTHPPRQLHPQDIILAIQRGEFAHRGEAGFHELTQLLLMACQWIVHQHHSSHSSAGADEGEHRLPQQATTNAR
ncbi:MAG: potassium channel family protein [Gemmataceae bacterium]|nr:potassium channel family protein [Gemmataceae bacterium]MCS7270434.1 potassium channel family protein [Gemmataceae bacterium]MDW8242467.1 potassium channel family protein [Thermogemmata sp.]